MSEEKIEEKKISKTKMVKDILSQDPTLKPMDIVKIMSEKGITIDNKYVSIIKSKIKTGNKKPVSVAKRRMSGHKSNMADSFEDLLAVKSLYDSLGADRIISAVKAIEKITK
jgi:hypothetical protein